MHRATQRRITFDETNANNYHLNHVFADQAKGPGFGAPAEPDVGTSVAMANRPHGGVEGEQPQPAAATVDAGALFDGLPLVDGDTDILLQL